ncbi:hypothetical protein TWF281_003090 [Arthrobotrys megalospora]
MKLSTAIALSLISLFVPALAAPSPAFSGVPMHVSGPVVPGGPNVELDGTAEEIVAKLDKLHPGWQKEQTTTGKRSLETRYWRGTPKCERIGGNGALEHHIQSGINHLNNLGERQCGAPARDCSRVSCSHGSAIFLCSNRDHPISVPCNRIGGAAQRIKDDCTNRTFTFFGYYVDGQWENTDGYTVYIRDGVC